MVAVGIEIPRNHRRRRSEPRFNAGRTKVTPSLNVNTASSFALLRGVLQCDSSRSQCVFSMSWCRQVGLWSGRPRARLKYIYRGSARQSQRIPGSRVRLLTSASTQGKTLYLELCVRQRLIETGTRTDNELCPASLQTPARAATLRLVPLLHWRRIRHGVRSGDLDH